MRATGIPGNRSMKSGIDRTRPVQSNRDDPFDISCKDGADIERLARDLEVMGNPVRLRILITLYKANKPLYFKDIADALSIEHNSLAYHVALLKSCDLVVNTIDKGKGRNYSTYLISDEGKELLGKFMKRIDAIT